MPHTPGPWTTAVVGNLWYVSPPGKGRDIEDICQGSMMTEQHDWKANQRAIAATPDVIEALAGLLNHIAFDARTDSQAKMDSMRAATAALRKAGV